MHACGGDDRYCDGEASAAPVTVLPGFYTVDYSSIYPYTAAEVASSSGGGGRLPSRSYSKANENLQQAGQFYPSLTGLRATCAPGYYRNWTLSIDSTATMPSQVCVYDDIFTLREMLNGFADCHYRCRSSMHSVPCGGI